MMSVGVKRGSVQIVGIMMDSEEKNTKALGRSNLPL